MELSAVVSPVVCAVVAGPESAVVSAEAAVVEPEGPELAPPVVEVRPVDAGPVLLVAALPEPSSPAQPPNTTHSQIQRRIVATGYRGTLRRRPCVDAGARHGGLVTVSRGVSFPIHRANYRTLDPDWEGDVFVADIDRTYLATQISSMRGMARIPFERAADKEDIAGMARLFREIRRGPGESARDTPLYFVSASPAQLRPVIERKMMLDGIGFDGTTFKNWSGVLRRLRFSRLREQVGFKLTALLAGRAELPRGAIENLVGDDLETDPLTYALYADIQARRIPARDLARILELNGVMETDARAIVRSLRELPQSRGVRRAFIRMERHADPEVFKDFGPGVVGCRGAFQMAAVLMHEHSISEDGAIRVGQDLLQRGLPPAELVDRLRDLCHRALLTPDETTALAERLHREASVPELGDPGRPDPSWEAVWQRGPERLWTPPRFVGE